MWILLLGMALMAVGFFMKPKELFWIAAAVVFAFHFGFPNENVVLYLLFILGVGLIVFELYIPDFGIAGIIGLAVNLYVVYQMNHDLTETVLFLIYGILIILVVFITMPKLGFKFSVSPNYILQTSLNKAEGFEASKDRSYLVGQIGVAMTDLRPIGKANFASDYYDVVSEDAFIRSGESIRVEKVVGSKIYVRKGEV